MGGVVGAGQTVGARAAAAATATAGAKDWSTTHTPSQVIYLHLLLPQRAPAGLGSTPLKAPVPAYLVDTTYYHLAAYLRSQVQYARRRTIGLCYRQTVPGRLQYQAATPTASLPDSLQQLDRQLGPPRYSMYCSGLHGPTSYHSAPRHTGKAYYQTATPTAGQSTIP